MKKKTGRKGRNLSRQQKKRNKVYNPKMAVHFVRINEHPLLNHVFFDLQTVFYIWNTRLSDPYTIRNNQTTDNLH